MDDSTKATPAVEEKEVVADAPVADAPAAEDKK